MVDMLYPYSQITLLTNAFDACLRRGYKCCKLRDTVKCSKPWILSLHYYLFLKHNHDLLQGIFLMCSKFYCRGKVPNWYLSPVTFSHCWKDINSNLTGNGVSTGSIYTGLVGSWRPFFTSLTHLSPPLEFILFKFSYKSHWSFRKNIFIIIWDLFKLL